MALLELKNVSTFYGNIHALKSISISVEEGEIVTLIGANGAGKTTTLMSICGITPVRSGEILLKGQNITKVSPNKIVQMGVSQVPEGRRIFPQLTVSENLDMGAFLRRDKEGIKRDMEEVFSIFPRLAERRNQLGGTLSGGEQQMLAISRALMANPHLLLLDEPSLGLAPLIVQSIFEIIQRINKERKTTILLVEQNANMALKIASKGYVLQNGVIKMADTAAHLLENEEVRKAYLGL
ncbi:leucine/isoleucine/valine transporter subunit; ATP-binding component of ABC superfamily [uncultured spirochete]|jgi:branched-chain amino acid transport system ATP-binding protein|uniref:Leucine/isoleucine/valine transporter subunit ATP-binding component of ABC superfamily n=1 Tax=uncultured spirochete TaxID=156406 RepID=A0A3P3XH34_9SPIR|nr:leucine/isoleucine/valine transporter subunit; ATP-binding component of ABC superfamily [uncultured spirochete]